MVNETMNKPTRQYAAKNQIHTDDCVHFMTESIEQGSVDLTVTSPPYDNLRNYEGYTFDFQKVTRSLYTVTRGGCCCLGCRRQDKRRA